MKSRARRVIQWTRVLQFTGLFVLIVSAAATLSLLPDARFDGPDIAMSQIGHRPEETKVALWIRDEEDTDWPDTFRIRRALSGDIVLEKTVPTAQTEDPATGAHVIRLDWTEVREPGEYVLELDGLGETEPFRVDADVYSELFGASLRALTFQRCGMAVSLGDWKHGICHRARVLELGDEDRLRPLPGGWHDAGNYDRYVPPAAFAVWHLLVTQRDWELPGEAWSSDALGIPESGNGIPDILDEARYELEWLLAMQREDGSVHHKLGKIDWTPVTRPEADHFRQYLYPVSSAATSGLVAVTARAATAFEAYDSVFAARCLDAARAGWSWLTENEGIVPAGGFRNPPEVLLKGGEYGDGQDEDERFWAAAELWRATGDEDLLVACRTGFVRWPRIVERPMTWSSMSGAGFVALLDRAIPVSEDDATNPNEQLREGLRRHARDVAEGIRSKGFPTVLGGGDYLWGSNAYALSSAVLMIVAAELGEPDAEKVALDQLHYVLGLNGLAQSFVTGFGWSSPRHPHHQPSQTDEIAEPVPGFLVGGPTRSAGGGGRPALRYVDTFDSYHTNEVAINWNAPLVFVAGRWATSPQPEAR
ncbi:MAG: glycoside hydrolase family 9 protein [Planctomycetota bacterium]